jgi:hypothetical protein
VKVAGQPYVAKGLGSCTHAPKASIYNVAAEMWSVRQEADNRSLQLTFWKPADGSASMFSLAVSGPANATISTVRGGEIAGQGTMTLAPVGKGGTFTIDGKGKNGTTIAGTVKCEVFTPAIADGGH